MFAYMIGAMFHILVTRICCNVMCTVYYIRPQGPNAPKKLDPTKISNPAIKECLQTNLKGALENQDIDPESVAGSWHNFTDAVYAA